MSRIRQLKGIVKSGLRPLTNRWITSNTISRDLKSIGIRRGGLLLVHSSLSRMGYVPGGARALILALKSAVGCDGTIMYPTHTWEWVNAGVRTFDVIRTPSCVGDVSELFRTLPGVLRSKHPTHSVAAEGPLSAEMVSGHEFASTPCGEGTPYARLIEKGGQILLLGCGTESNTCFHTLEAQFHFPYLLQESETLIEIRDAKGNTEQHKFFLHRDVPIRGESIKRRFGEMEKILVDQGVARIGYIGGARSVLIEGDEMLSKLGPLLRANPLYFLAEAMTKQ